jgi:beta-galactosidase GanA
MQLQVDGAPFLIIGGELGNSTASEAASLSAALARCSALHLNTVLVPVYWDLVEPAEGQFDFALVRHAINQARQHGLRLIYLWFGTWKNSMSCYAPAWVKRDTARFARVQRADGVQEEIISPESTQAMQADASAFAALMRWTKDYDATHRTVIMVQVENEVGMIPEARDHSPMSERRFHAPVPAEVLARLAAGQLGPELAELHRRAGGRPGGSWGEVFGDDAHGSEVFSAWQLSTYTEAVAAAGRREYPLPMFVNAALIRPGYQPGQYPSAGPLPHLLELWRLCAPAIDLLCPDIYFPNFMEWCGRYERSGNAVFVPEMAATRRASGNAAYAVGRHRAMGYAPFAIEDVTGDVAEALTSLNRLMAGAAGEILKAQAGGAGGRIVGLSPQVGFDWACPDEPQRARLGDVVFEARFERAAAAGDVAQTTLPTLGTGRWDAPPGTPTGAAVIWQVGADEYVVLGMGVKVTVHPADAPAARRVGIESAQEGQFEAGGGWVGGRWLNGDQTHQGRHLHFHDGQWSMQRVRLYRYG